MKSHVSDLLELATVILMDTLAGCVANESAARDVETLTSRVEHEGLSFLTITLPAFCADFERSIREGAVGSTYFRSFRKYKRIPAFLRGIVSLVFDVDTGAILDEPSASAVKSVRQICLAFKKVKLPCSPGRVDKAYEGFRQDERDLSVPLDPELVQYFERVAHVMWHDLGGDHFDDPHHFIPKHGPGATAEKISGNQKFIFRKWHKRLEPYFPLDLFAYHNVNAFESKEFKELTLVERDDEQPVRVITVPKTLKSPRIIAIEPVCMQYTQQAVARGLIHALEHTRISAGHVNFTDQSINRDIAMSSSMTGIHATLDLSSASDRVPLSLVVRMLRHKPHIMRAVVACRSRNAKLQDGSVIRLRKFASMGSAMCFPIESMYFYTLCVAARLELHKLPVTSRNAHRMSREVYIYGDDIIVPADEATVVMRFLQKYYCRVNMSKSFWSGSFRESCGMDAFRGVDVTPVYVREVRPHNKRDANQLVSWNATANQFYLAGLWQVSSYLHSKCEQILGPLPVVGKQCAGLGRVSFLRSVSIQRWSPRYQCPEVRTWVASPVYRTDKLDGYSALLKCLLQLQDRPPIGPRTVGDHLNKSARHGAVALKRRWTQPY